MLVVTGATSVNFFTNMTPGDKNLINLRRYIKIRIQKDTNFVGHEEERKEILSLVSSTIQYGESNSALLIGRRGSGKTTLVNSVLKELEEFFQTDATLVRLHGLIHTDDRLALKSITSQMSLENAVDGKVFGSFAENLSFLLACLKSGEKGVSKSIIFVIEKFDLFCLHHNQTLLYNLFDVCQSPQAPICVLGITNHTDVIGLLEKRVKSRFSHRQIYLCPENSIEHRLKRLADFLILPVDENLDVTEAARKQWNSHIHALLKDKNFKKLMQRVLDLDAREQFLKNILFVIMSQLDENNSTLTYKAFSDQIQTWEKDKNVQLLQDLGVLELTLIISMKHHREIYDNHPMNFEMVYNRYLKFANSNSNIQTVERPVVMKAFEQILNLELISMLSSGNSGIQKEYQLFKLQVTPQEIREAVKGTPGLPTEVVQYANSSLI